MLAVIAHALNLNTPEERQMNLCVRGLYSASKKARTQRNPVSRRKWKRGREKKEEKEEKEKKRRRKKEEGGGGGEEKRRGDSFLP